MADSNLRELERQALGGDISATIALERGRARAGTCPACGSAPACYLLEGEDEESRIRTCASKLPACEDCEGESACEDCEGDGEDSEGETCGPCEGSGERPEPCDRCEGVGLDPFGIVIDGEPYILESNRHLGFDADLWELEPSSGYSPSFIVAIDAEVAGKGARERWAEMASSDPSEFACMVGEATLVQWGMGHSAGPGSTQVTSLSDWLDLWLDTPEEEWAGYDGAECEVTETGADLIDAIGFLPTVAYRSN